MAVNQSKIFERKRFGEAEQFLIYEWNESQLLFQEVIKNPRNEYRQNSNSPVNAQQIVDLLKSKNINILVSKRFGVNIKWANSFFIPVKIEVSTLDELIPLLSMKMKWIEEEWQDHAGNYKLFNLSKGILKTTIKKDEEFNQRHLQNSSALWRS